MLSKSQRLSLITQLRIERELERRRAQDCLYSFTRFLWPIIEPETEFVDGWHIRAICKTLESFTRFEIPKLVINIPPRHMKSILACVMLPAWVWGRHPERSFIYGSHSLTLATRDSIKTRQVILSERYQEVFKPDWCLLEDQNLKTSFKNDRGGSRHSVGVGSGITGFGCDYSMIDDPTSAKDAYSEVAREEAKFWHDSVLSTRVNNPRRHGKCIIMQRLHEDDLTGHVIIKNQGYKKLILPAEYDPDIEIKTDESLGVKDPRTKTGEILWPEQWDAKAIQDAKIVLGDDAHAQLNQDPRPASGGLFPASNWKYWTTSPSDILETVLFIDAAQKPGVSNDYSVFAVWARTPSGYYLLDLGREKTDATLLEALTLSYFTKWRPSEVVIEDKSAGSSLIQYLLKNTTLPVTPYDPGRRDKVVRAAAATPTVRAGKCYLPNAPILVQDESGKEVNLIELFVKEHERFPKAKHDDMVDTTSMAVDHFSKRAVVGPRVRSLV